MTNESEPLLALAGASVRFGSFAALADVDLQVRRGEFIALVGSNGSGKTTLLHALHGLLPLSGTRRVGGGGAAQAMVFQRPFMLRLSVLNNLRIALWLTGVPRAERDARASEALQRAGLADRARSPALTLSGGQQQRLALARALVTRPELMLLDEPLSNLDAKLRETMRFELKRLQRELNLTAIYVTHDQAEALVMSSRIAVMNEGRVEQIGKPREIYTRPATRFVAEFIGTSNFLEGKVVAVNGTEVEVDTPHGRLVAADPPRRPVVGDPVLLSVRPECVDLSRERRSVPNEWTGTVRTRAFLGDVVDHVVRIGDTEIRNRSNPTLSIPPGTEVHFSVAPDKVTLVPVD